MTFPRLALQYVLSFLFILQMYVALAIVGIGLFPWALFSSRGAFFAVHIYCRWVRFSAHWMVGLRSEIRGEVPQTEVIVASKHQSFFDILILSSVLPKPKFVMKASLKYAPVIGWYGRQIGCVAVDRSKGGRAVNQMVTGMQNPKSPKGGQLIIYPQGTRVAPGVDKVYKVGVGALYEALGQTVIPAATNVGVFWPRHGVLRKPGLAVIEFLPPIPPGVPLTDFLVQLRETIEPASDKLMEEAGFKK